MQVVPASVDTVAGVVPGLEAEVSYLLSVLECGQEQRLSVIRDQAWLNIEYRVARLRQKNTRKITLGGLVVGPELSGGGTSSREAVAEDEATEQLQV